MKGRILVVDDDRQIVRTLCDILRLEGWEVDGVFTGEEAVAAVARRRYPVVLMDIRMPGMDGVEAFKAMKAAQPPPRVVFMTAYTAADLIQEAEREGALKVVAKPVDLTALLQLLKEAVSAERPILVVDDDPAFLRTLCDLLRERGYHAIPAQTLDTALRKLEADTPAVVLLDLRLDDIEPSQAVLAIKRVSPAVILILYSGHPPTLDETATAVPADWVYAYLRKPFPVDRLMGLLRHVLVG